MKNSYYLEKFYAFIPISLLILTPEVVFAQNSKDQKEFDHKRENIVVAIKQGQVASGLQQLKFLHQQQPQDQKVLADYLLLSLQNHYFKSEDDKLLSHIQSSTFPQYAHIPLIKGLRDLKQFTEALRLTDAFIAVTPTQAVVVKEQVNHLRDLKLLRALLLAENQQKDLAKAQLKDVATDQLNLDQLIQLSYAYRLVGQPIYSLTLMQRAQQTAPNAAKVQAEYANVLLALGANQQAMSMLKQQPESNVDQGVQQQAVLAEFSENIRDAIKNQKYLSRQGETDLSSFQQLDQVLAQAESVRKQFPIGTPLYNRFQYEYIYALSYRGRHQEAIDTATAFNLGVDQMPAYVRHAIADAYLAQKKPAQAERLYRSLLTEKNYADMNLYSALYYALIDQEKYQQANQFIQQVDKLIPTFQYSFAKGVDKRVHPDRADYLGLKETAHAYANQLNLAENNLKDMTEKSPNNEDYLNALVRVQRWRELPETAQATLSRLNGLEPKSKTTKINQMQNDQALGDIQAWREQAEQLHLFYPTDSSVIKSRKELFDRNRFSISHDTRFSKSEANQDQVLETLKGSKDIESSTRINSPWFSDNYRAFAQYDDRMGDYRDGKIHDQRIGLGAEWESKRKSLSVMASQQIDGDRAGFDIDWKQHLNDFWSYQLNFTTQAPVPLQALKQDHDAKGYGIGLNWQANESKKAGLQYQATDISDGNLRQELSASYRQTLFSQPHHTTRGGISAYYGKNSTDQVPYFSPKSSYSVGVDLNHDWLTWRQDEQSLTQQFAVSTGFYDQSQHSAKAVFDLRYSHLWQLTRTWGLRYGVGWNMHPYDGINEKQWYGNFGFEGRF
ncbi:poly-beta-1,6 N-acetyl-D-glucosamine export porin PgaA [Acinetobacter sp. 187]|uniref:poly-beta-1,6 N-acetyl-D-glucosamine export porin PgaA n=1 Tax=Acinetobacter lanii TaxID=2715163 RepID=UPI00140A0AAF|nr:poly-beta-1,6 N-acetyl-D-glucosamine export porin PgaA [Acinetobacter lanii]NHC02197.1 poly-beta-1,6 N-acetyl-D-glucosamine export porin PgaA [Acinetobacter lanii]